MVKKKRRDQETKERKKKERDRGKKREKGCGGKEEHNKTEILKTTEIPKIGDGERRR